jgi:hypothetical protein
MRKDINSIPEIDIEKVKFYQEKRNEFAHGRYILCPPRQGVRIQTRTEIKTVDIDAMKKDTAALSAYVGDLRFEIWDYIYPNGIEDGY